MMINWAVSGAVAILSVISFVINYNGDFVFDDVEAIVNNKDISSEGSLAELFQHDFWGGNLSSNNSHKSYRPLTVISFRLNYAMAGGYFPVTFHIVNIILHTTVCILLHHVLHKVIKLRQMKKLTDVPWITTLLFTVHPLHTEVVNNIVGRAEMLCALMFLLSFNAYTSACHEDNILTRYSLWKMFQCCIFCFISVLCKEQGIMVLGLCIMYDVFLYIKIQSKTIKEHGTVIDRVKNIGQTGMLRHSILFIAGIIILGWRWWIMGGTTPVFQPVDNPHSFVNNTGFRILNYHYIYALNGWLCFCPWWLCFDWSMGCVPVINNFTDIRLIAVIIFWTSLIGLFYKINSCYHYNSCVLFAVSLTVLTFLPATNLLFRVGFVIAERVLYLPTVGTCLLQALSLYKIVALFPHTKFVMKFCTYSLLFMYTIQCMRRSVDWKNEMSLFEAGRNVCPLNAKVHYNIGKVYADSGYTEKALDEYKVAIRLHPEYDQALNNLGNLMKEKGNLHEAERYLLKAINIRTTFAAAWMNLGIVQAALNKTSSAEHSYNTAIKYRKKYPDCYYNLGNLYLDLQHHSEALIAWRNATLQNPYHTSAWFNMINLLDNLDRQEELQLVAEEAIKWNSNEASLHFAYANGLGKAGYNQASETQFLLAIKIQPNEAKYYSNLGVLYHRWKKYHKAYETYMKALQLDPHNSNTQVNINMLKRQLHKQKDNT